MQDAIKILKEVERSSVVIVACLLYNAQNKHYFRYLSTRTSFISNYDRLKYVYTYIIYNYIRYTVYTIQYTVYTIQYT